MVAPKHPPVPGPDPRLYAQLEALPEHLTGEIIDGHLIVSPRPATPHAACMTRLAMLLGPLFEFGGGGRPGGWWFLLEPELHLGRDVAAPDLAGWRQSRLPVVPDVAALTLAPDWVAEGISGNGEYDRAKLPTYARHAVKHVWLLDPRARTLEVLRHTKGALQVVATFEGSVKVKVEPFQAAELDLGLLWLPNTRPSRRKKPKA